MGTGLDLLKASTSIFDAAYLRIIEQPADSEHGGVALLHGYASHRTHTSPSGRKQSVRRAPLPAFLQVHSSGFVIRIVL
jgi:hypothetical protein